MALDITKASINFTNNNITVTGAIAGVTKPQLNNNEIQIQITVQNTVTGENVAWQGQPTDVK